jgi:hypothetical protein
MLNVQALQKVHILQLKEELTALKAENKLLLSHLPEAAPADDEENKKLMIFISTNPSQALTSALMNVSLCFV